MEESVFQQCLSPACRSTFGWSEAIFSCPRCGGLLDVSYDWSRCPTPSTLSFFDSRRGSVGSSPTDRVNASGVWRFRELLPIAPWESLVTIGEGQTLLQQADGLAFEIGLRPGRLFLQYEGCNPSGSFKDNGMAAAFTVARRLGRRRVACASTGNTSASMALYARQTLIPSGHGDSTTAMQAVVFVGGGKIAVGKLAQALDHGAKTIQIEGDFDACMRLVVEASGRLELYVVNSINPFRLEGQKAIMYRVLEGLGWEVPDWIIVPGGNLGNCSAFGKAFMELKTLGLVDRVPRLAVINAAGANALYEMHERYGIRYNGGAVDRKRIDECYTARRAEGREAARTIASAIEIGRPVNLIKALRSLEVMNGVVRQATDEEILDGKALVGRFGFGCEPASGATVAGLRLLFQERVILPDDRVVCILTGHGLKDPGVTVDYHTAKAGPFRGLYANPAVTCPADLEDILRVLAS